MNVEADLDGLIGRVLQKARVPAQSADAAPVAAQAKAPPFADAEWALPGIAGETRVATNFGQVPAHLVRKGDRLRTRDGNFVPVLRSDAYRLDADFLARHPEAAPVIIRARSLDRTAPARDVAVSPSQPVSRRSDRWGGETTLARNVSTLRGRIDPSLGIVAYFRFRLPYSCEINCEGLWVSVVAD